MGSWRPPARAQASGFDGIEVFAAYHAVVDQFWAPWSNRREDDWGGTFEHRMRFSAELLGRIRERCGDDFIIGLAVSVDPGAEATPGIDELTEIVAWHDERRLMDYVTCGTGSYFAFEAIIPPSLYEQRLGEPFAAALKAGVRHAVVQAESHIRTPAAAEAVLAAGHADMVSIVRGQIADPHLVAKARAGRADEVRPCISCNQLCWGRRSRDYWISCLINPSAGRELEWGGDRFEPARLPPRPGDRWRAGRTGGCAGRGRARPHVTLWEAARPWAASSGSPGSSPPAARSRICSRGTDGAWRARRRGPARRGDERRRPPRSVPTRSSSPPAHGRRARVPARAPDGRPAARGGRSDVVRSTTCWTARPTRSRACSCSTTSTTGAASGRRSTWPSRTRGDDPDLRGPVVAGGLFHSAADGPLRSRYAAGRRPVDHVGRHPRTGGRPRDPPVDATGEQTELDADTLVIAETPVAETGLAEDLARPRRGRSMLIGDCVAPRRASLAFYEGRELALRL